MTVKIVNHHLVGPVALVALPPIDTRGTLPFKNYFKTEAALAGAAVPSDWAAKALPALRQMYLNDRLGCCVISYGAHQEGVWTGNVSGEPVIFPDATILAEYEAIGGYNPANPATDNGCNPVDALNSWTAKGFGGRTPWAGWLTINATDPREVEVACDEFGGLMIVLGLPDAWVANNMAMIKPYGTLDAAGAADPSNGHCTGMVARVADGRFKIATWGMEVYFTPAALANYCVPAQGGGLFAGVSPDWADAIAKRTPSHIAYARLIADMNARKLAAS
jgi:hypothetical protein